MQKRRISKKMRSFKLIFFASLIFMLSFTNISLNISNLEASSEPTLLWQTYWDLGENDEASAIVLDNEGNIYVLGNTGPLNGANDVFLLKYDSSGNLQSGWPVTWDSGEHEWALDMAIGPNGYIYVVGFTYIPLNPNDVFLLKYDSSGKLQSGWPKIWHADVMVEIYDMEIDSNDNIYIAGNTRTGEDLFNTFILKFNSTGYLQPGWPVTWDSGTTDVARIVTLSPDGYIYLSGDTRLGENPWNVFLLKYDSSGKLQSGWPKIWDSGSPDWSFGMTIDYDGNIYLTGFTAYGENPTNTFILKFDSVGNLQLGYPAFYDSGKRKRVQEHELFSGEDRIFKVKTSIDGSIYAVGATNYGNNPFNILLLKYDPSGNLQSGFPYYWDSGESDEAFNIALDDANNIYVAGYIELDKGTKDVLVLKIYDKPTTVLGPIALMDNFFDFRYISLIIIIIIAIGLIFLRILFRRQRLGKRFNSQRKSRTR